MTAKSRYWDHERCAWVAYESAPVVVSEAAREAVPEQRADDETAAAPADSV
jgi:hypothetical protein